LSDLLLPEQLTKSLAIAVIAPGRLLYNLFSPLWTGEQFFLVYPKPVFFLDSFFLLVGSANLPLSPFGRG